MSLPAILEFLIVLGIMVLVHEFGHFAAAKLCGIRVEVFSIGFGPRLFGYTYGDTDYRICALPLGGYVKMAGDAPGSEPEEGSWNTDEFNGHPRWQRIIVALAGPFANFILAFLLLLGLNMAHHQVDEFLSQPTVVDYVPAKSPLIATGIQPGDTVVHFDTIENPHFDDIFNRTELNLNQRVAFSYLHNGQRTNTTALLTTTASPEKLDPYDFFVPRMQPKPVQISPVDKSVAEGTPAQRAGLKGGDILLSIDGFTPHSVSALLAFLQDEAGKPAHLVLERNGTTIATDLTPALSPGPDGTKYRIGFAPVQPPVKIERLGPLAAARESVKQNWKAAGMVRDIVAGLFSHHISIKAMSGPIGIGQQVHQAFQMPGWNPILETMAMISLQLGMLNLLPFPILDGGMILFLLIESVLRRDVNIEVKERIYQAAFVCLIALFAFILVNDVSKLGLFSHLKS
jgi:regulator of sigma E protease